MNQKRVHVIAYVQSDEVSSLATNWPTYRGKKIGSDDIRAWFEQVASHKDQRLLFTLLQKLTVFSEVEIREKLKTAHGFVRPKLSPDFVITKRVGRTDIVVTYVDGEGKSGQYYAARYAEENQIPTRSILAPSKFSPLLETYRLKNSVSVIVIVDDIISTGESLSKRLATFVRDNEIQLKKLNVPLIAIALTGTDAGMSRVREQMDDFAWIKFELRVCDPLLDNSFAFHKSNGFWQSADQLERAKALCNDIGVNIYRDAPLGYGDQGLLIVFPDTCPNNTLPVIHSGARADAPRKWMPLFPRIHKLIISDCAACSVAIARRIALLGNRFRVSCGHCHVSAVKPFFGLDGAR